MEFVDKESLPGLLRAMNPWWQGQTPAVEPFRRVAFRQCRHSLEHPSLNRAVLLRAPRRAGKTTLLRQLADHLVSERGVAARQVLYLDLSHPLLKPAGLSALVGLYHDEIAPRGPGCYLLLDEAHLCANGQQDLHRLMADGPGYRLVAAGTGNLAPPPGFDASGVGRWVPVTMPVLSFYEYAHLLGRTDGLPEFIQMQSFPQRKADELAGIAASFQPLRALMGPYLLGGAFPELARDSDTAGALSMLRERVLERVLRPEPGALRGLRKLEHLERLAVYLCLQAGRPFSPEACAKALDSSRATVLSHLEALEAAQLVSRIPPCRPGGKKVQRARDMAYLADGALRAALLMRGPAMLDDPAEAQVLMASAVFRHIRAAYHRDSPILGYWRDPTGARSVEFVTGNAERVRCIAVTYRSSAAVEPKGGLAAYLAREPRAMAAYQVTRDDADFGVSRLPGISAGVLRVPAHIFLYAVGMSERRIAAGAEDPGL